MAPPLAGEGSEAGEYRGAPRGGDGWHSYVGVIERHSNVAVIHRRGRSEVRSYEVSRSLPHGRELRPPRASPIRIRICMW